MQKLCQCWPCTQWLMKPPREWRKWWLRPWGSLTILPPPPTAGLSEVRLSLVFLPIGLTLTVSKDAQQPIACKQLRGLHTFDVLASTLNDIHSEFEIWGKILRTTIDNGPNFIKAFQVFGEDENNNAIRSDGDASQPGEDEEDQERGEEVEIVDVSVLLNEDDGFKFQLPKHQHCACHLLNLIVDTGKATSNEAYQKVHRSTFGKCNALWNKCGRSTLAAKTVKDACSLQLLRLNATRWNSCSWQWKDYWG